MITTERVIELYDELREKCYKLAKANDGELMGKDAWLRHALLEGELRLQWGEDGVTCYGSTFTSQTQDHEWFEFTIPHDLLE